LDRALEPEAASGVTGGGHQLAPDAALLAELMEATGLSDACAHLDCGDDHIDRFFFRSGELIEVLPTAWRVAGEFVDPSGADLSDHPAINVDFDWTTL
jgi:hypothetical protein